MPRAPLIRADTIDLQDHNAPSAKDHSRQPASPAALGEGPPAPHQAASLRRASADESSLVGRSPRASQDLSGKELQLLQEIHSDLDDQDAAEIEASLGISRNGDQGAHAHHDGDAEGEDDEEMDDDMMDKISSSPSIDDEDIDFEFVYALHTFVATVEGQANATKGDTMVLLDDSNSYWWLVRVVKDSSIGYLPAEHIETPTERLARLNKHRNIDLSQTMLGDNPEKSRNPLKKAMRRRNVKTVTFTDPTYYEPEPEDFSSEDEGDEDPEFITTADASHDQSADQQQEQEQERRHGQEEQNQQYEDDDSDEDEPEPKRVQPLRIRPVGYEQVQDKNGSGKSPTNASSPKTDPRIDRPRASEESMDSSDGGAMKSPRRMRNTDSFYKDESIETRKISLTPNLLRDSDAAGAGGGVQDARASLEGKDRQDSVEKVREEKKKEKKPSKFSGFFKRKNSKSKPTTDDEADEWAKPESQSSRGGSPQPKQSQESLSADPAPTSPVKAQPARQSSKLQKSQRGNSLRRSNSRDEQASQKSPTTDSAPGALKLDTTTSGGSDLNPFDDSAALDAEQQGQVPQSKVRSAEGNDRVTSPNSESLRNVFNPVRDAFRGAPAAQTTSEPKVEKVKKAKNRMALDDSDSDDDVQDPTASFPAAPTRQALDSTKERLSESPVQVSLAASQPGGQRQPAPALVPDNSSPSVNGVSPVSPSSSPELIERPADEPIGTQAARTATPTMGGTGAGMVNGDAASAASNTPGSATGSTRSRVPEWSDAMLRDYMDRCGDEFRDMLAIVCAPSGKEAEVNRDDPIWKRHEETMARAGELQKKLDRVLLDFYKSRGVDF